MFNPILNEIGKGTRIISRRHKGEIVVLSIDDVGGGG